MAAGFPMKASPVARHPLAARRILRLAFGVSACLLTTQALALDLAFVAPAITLMLLALPLPAPTMKQGLVVVLALLLPMVASLALLPFLVHARWAGILLMALALFHTFHFTARGGPAALGAFMTIGLTLVVTVGSISPELLVRLIQYFAANALAGVAFVWVAHALLPDPAVEAARAAPPRPPAPPPEVAVRNALRALMVVLPLTLVFLFSSASAAYIPVMIKVASMGQQATTDQSRHMGRSLLTSTVWGGAAAFAAWTLMRVWPGLFTYTLVIALGGLAFGVRIFRGPAVAPDHDTWSYAYLTMLVLLGPAVTDSPLSDGIAFGNRLFLFLVIAVYGTAAVAIHDAFWGRRPAGTQPLNEPGKTP